MGVCNNILHTSDRVVTLLVAFICLLLYAVHNINLFSILGTARQIRFYFCVICTNTDLYRFNGFTIRNGAHIQIEVLVTS